MMMRTNGRKDKILSGKGEVRIEQKRIFKNVKQLSVSYESVSTKTVYKLVRENRIPSVKVGREIRIAKSELINYLRQRDVKSPQISEPDNTQKYVWTLENLCGIVRVGHNTMTHQNTKGEDDYGCQKNTGCKRSG